MPPQKPAPAREINEPVDLTGFAPVPAELVGSGIDAVELVHVTVFEMNGEPVVVETQDIVNVTISPNGTDPIEVELTADTVKVVDLGDDVQVPPVIVSSQGTNVYVRPIFEPKDEQQA